MKVYLDTNVLIAASVQDHQHHPQSFELLLKIKEGTIQGCVSAHGLAEFYSVLTRAPFVPRVHPAEAERILEENLLVHFELFWIDSVHTELQRLVSRGHTFGALGVGRDVGVQGNLHGASSYSSSRHQRPAGTVGSLRRRARRAVLNR